MLRAVSAVWVPAQSLGLSQFRASEQAEQTLLTLGLLPDMCDEHLAV